VAYLEISQQGAATNFFNVDANFLTTFFYSFLLFLLFLQQSAVYILSSFFPPARPPRQHRHTYSRTRGAVLVGMGSMGDTASPAPWIRHWVIPANMHVLNTVQHVICTSFLVANVLLKRQSCRLNTRVFELYFTHNLLRLLV
jgi:phage shock protein PspC (stress-responsive transcriptional regulator)